MRRMNAKTGLVFMCILGLFISTLYAAVPGDKCCKKNSNIINKKEDLKTLRYLKEVEWPKSFREHDAKLLDRILAEEFELIDGIGDRSNKKDQMAYLKSNTPFHKYFKFKISRLELFENGTAIISGTGHAKGTNSKGEAYEFTYESSNVLIKRKGIWKAISSHVSGVKEKKIK